MRQWRLIPDWEDYMVSDDGYVFDIIKNRYVQPSQGKFQVWLKKGSTFRTASRGRLVLEAFVGPCPDGMECCHWDDNKDNNKLENLRWGTDKNNADDRVRNGRGFLGNHCKKGNDNAHSILNEEQVREARILRKQDRKTWTWKQLADRYGVNLHCVRLAVIGKNWGHVI